MKLTTTEREDFNAFLADIGYDEEDFLEILLAEREAKLRETRNQRAEKLRKDKEAMLGKYFVDSSYGDVTYYKVMMLGELDELVCLTCHPYTMVYYMGNNCEEAELEESVCLENVPLDYLQDLKEITADQFADAVRRYAENVISLTI